MVDLASTGVLRVGASGVMARCFFSSLGGAVSSRCRRLDEGEFVSVPVGGVSGGEFVLR